jgi:hypothetical protein
MNESNIPTVTLPGQHAAQTCERSCRFGNNYSRAIGGRPVGVARVTAPINTDRQKARPLKQGKYFYRSGKAGTDVLLEFP